MKKSQLLVGIGFFAAACGVLPAANDDCEKVAKAVAAAISEEPEKVLMIVDERVTAFQGCACEIVKSAIKVVEADKALTAQIVTAAVNAAAEKAAIITECAIAANPDAAREIKAALREVFEGAQSSGEQALSESEVIGGEEVIVDEAPDYTPANNVVSGVYMIAPVAPSGDGSERQLEKLARELGVPVSTLKKILEPGGPSIKDLIKRRPSITLNKTVTTTPPPQSP